MQMIIQKVICKKVLRLQQMGCLTKGLQNENLNRNEGNMQLANTDPLQGSSY